MNNNAQKELENYIKDTYSNLNGIVVYKDGVTLYENYLNDTTELDTHHIASVTKSITSILIGIAIDLGYIQSVDQKVLDFFVDYKVKRGEKLIQEVTIKDLLTMKAPFKYKYEPYTKVYMSEDWVYSTLDLLSGRINKDEFHYTTVGVQILSGILIHATGQSLNEFAYKYLFAPLRIHKPHSSVIYNKEDFMHIVKDKHVQGWACDPSGSHTAGWGLCLTTNDMAKIGQLYLNDGVWENQQIISKEYIHTSTSKHSVWPKLNLDYGYLWWIIDEHCYAAIGDGGNVIYINKKEHLVIAISSSFQPRAKDRIELIKNYIEPWIKKTGI